MSDHLQTQGEPLREGDRYPDWPEGFYWSEEYERPVYLAQRGDSSASVDGRANPLSPSLRAVGVPHLDRACEILWETGHPRIAEALRTEVEAIQRG